jgi:hypothetical protein
MDQPRVVQVMRAIALLGFASASAACSHNAQAQARSASCPSTRPESGASCNSSEPCDYYRGPAETRSLAAHCVCEAVDGSAARQWNCRTFSSRGPLPPPELDAAEMLRASVAKLS